jgi:uncharacterized membrane protein YgcG
MRRTAIVVLALVAWLSVPGLAAASEAGDVLRHRDAYAAPGSPASPADVTRLEDAAASLRRRGAPTRFAVFAARPAEGSPAAARALRQEIGFDGTLLLMAPGTLGVSSSRVSQTAIQRAYSAALPTLRADLIGGAIAVARQLATESASSSRTGGKSGAAGAVVTLLVLVALAGGIAFLVVRTRRRKAAQSLEDRRAALEPLVDGLATQITEIGPEVEAGGPSADAARADYDAALTEYGDARDALPRAADEGAVKLAALKLESGLRAAARARAALDGKPPPAPDAPLLEGLCTFDPKHGRAITTAAVSGPSGRLEEVPVCAECRDRLAGGVTPDVRTVAVGGRPVPYFTGMPPLGGGTGLGPLIGAGVGGFLLAELLDSGPAYGYGYGSGGGFGWEDRDRFEGDDASGGGDFDWGGGSDDDSFGGGDFDSGGGDFGGGDSGGDF